MDVAQPDITLGPEFLTRVEPLLAQEETAVERLLQRGSTPPTSPTSC